MAEQYLKDGIEFMKCLSGKAKFAMRKRISVYCYNFRPSKVYIGIGKEPYYFGKSVKNPKALLNSPEIKEFIEDYLLNEWNINAYWLGAGNCGCILPLESSSGIAAGVPKDELVCKVMKKDNRIYLVYDIWDIKKYIANNLFNCQLFLGGTVYLAEKYKYTINPTFHSVMASRLKESFKRITIEDIQFLMDIGSKYAVMSDKYVFMNCWYDCDTGKVHILDANGKPDEGVMCTFGAGGIKNITDKMILASRICEIHVNVRVEV